MKRTSKAFLFASILVASACDSKTAPSHAAASEVTHPIAETALPVVRLSAEAISRLHVETTTVRQGAVPRTRLVGEGDASSHHAFAHLPARHCTR